MAPTLAEGEMLEVDLTAYTGYSPARWHIVTFQSPEGAGFLNYRVVGLPGDVVSYDAKKVLRINGNAVTLTRIDLNIAQSSVRRYSSNHSMANGISSMYAMKRHP